MTKGLSTGSLNRFSAPPSFSEGPGGVPHWQADHQARAEGILEKAFALGPPWPDQAPFDIEPPPFDPHGEAILRQMVSLSSNWEACRGVAPGSPQLMMIAAPDRDDDALLELMRLLTAHDVRHVIVLGDLNVHWTRDPGSQRDMHHLTTVESRPLQVVSEPDGSTGSGWTSTLEFQLGAPTTSRHPDQTRVWQQQHRVHRLQVPAMDTGLLSPESLRTAMDWLQDQGLGPDQRVAVLAREDGDRSRPCRHDEKPLLTMGGQLALGLALQGLQRPSAAEDGLGPPSDDSLLRDAVAQLHQHQPALVGGVAHVCAALAAHEEGPRAGW